MDNCFKDKCYFCCNIHINNGSICCDVGPNMYLCTREEGHGGDHVACSSNVHYHCRWTNTQDTIEQTEEENKI